MSEGTGSDIIKSVRTFLKNEAEMYGAFQLPETDSDTESDTVSDITQKTQPDALPGTLPNTPAKSLSNKQTVTPANTPSESTIETPDLKKSDPGTGIKSTSESKDREVNELDQVATLEELRTICMASDVLKTDLQGTNLVFGTGDPEADIMFIGEAPGAQEDKQGEPFVGKAGLLLNKILAAISLKRDEVYIANILKHRPPNNRDPLPVERSRSLPFLFRQIELVNPKWIVCLGRISAQTLLDTNRPMKTLRGTFHPFHNGIELMVTFHPAALLRNPAWKRDTWEDVKMLRRRYDEVKKSEK